MGAAFVNIFNRMECLKRGVVGTFKQVEYLYAAFVNIFNRMGWLKRGVASIFNRMEWSGVALAEWFHPEKQLGVALARDNHCSLSRKMPSLAITTTRYRENYPRPR